MSDQAKPRIEVTPNGPYVLHGMETIRNSREEPVHVGSRIALCRCGQSNRKPYCDGTHAKVGFAGVRESKAPLDREKAYAGEHITIHDNRTICSHAAECVNTLGAVFSLERRPWIDPEGATAEAVIDMIRRCPSGALSYSIDGKRHRDYERQPSVKVCADGPYNVSGGIELKAAMDLQPPSQEHYTLCRCGASKNKPFCDGTHHTSGFKDNS